MMGSFIIPDIMFLQGIGRPHDMLVQAMGVSFTVSTVAHSLALQFVSVAALIPAQRMRRRLADILFRQTLLMVMSMLGT